MIVIDGQQIDRSLTWTGLVDALDAGHRVGRGQTHDLLLEEGGDILLNRTAWVKGYGLGLKTVTGFFGNPERDPPMPSVQGVFVLFDHHDGRPISVIDGAGITAWKTAADSALGSRYLSRQDARCLLMVGAGAMARPLIEAHRSIRPGIERVMIWNRSAGRARELADALAGGSFVVEVTGDIAGAAAQADVISVATKSEQPLIHGAWLRPGTHLDLVGAFTPAMREADDEAIGRARLFVDARETTIGHVGELMIPIERGIITADEVLADLYDLADGFEVKRAADDITLYKNGGGAHLDLMTAIAIHQSVTAGSSAT